MLAQDLCEASNPGFQKKGQGVKRIQLMVNCWFGARWFGILRVMAVLWLINGGDPNYLLTGVILQGMFENDFPFPVWWYSICWI